jgi:hypothetical protein
MCLALLLHVDLFSCAFIGRFEADVAAMQRDSSTYCDEPEDCEEFEAWLAGFDLAARKPDVDRLIAENTFMSELQVRFVSTETVHACAKQYLRLGVCMCTLLGLPLHSCHAATCWEIL